MKSRFHIYLVAHSLFLAVFVLPVALLGQGTSNQGSSSAGLDPEFGKPFPTYSKIKGHIHSPLFQAIMEGDTIRAVEMIKAGTNVNEHIEAEVTPLMVSASMGQMSVVQALLDKGADVTITNREGRTALMLAAVQGRVPMMQLLVNRGSEINLKDSLGRTALILAVMSGNSNAVETILKAGAEVNAKDQKGKTALNWAATSDLEDIARLLLKKGADPAIKDASGWVPQDYARILRKTNLVETLKYGH